MCVTVTVPRPERDCDNVKLKGVDLDDHTNVFYNTKIFHSDRVRLKGNISVIVQIYAF